MCSLAVICANPPTFNAGMHSVDLAFWRVVGRHRIAADVRFYCLPGAPPSVEAEAELPFVYEDAYQNLASIRDSDVVVYWGDFLHSRLYFKEVRKRLRRSLRDKSPDELASVERAVFFLEGARSRPRTIVVFGGNLSVLDTGTLADDAYVQSLRGLYRRASLILMRDPFSAIAVNHVLADFGSNHCGVDCAFLLDDATSLSMYRKRSRRPNTPPRVGVFAGRTQSYDMYLAFFQRVCDRLGSQGIWLPWFHRHRPAPLIEEYGEVFDATSADCGVEDTLRLLDACDVVLTDTYHLCVNAWARGIPAICVGRGAGAMRRTTDDKKKELLCAMLGVGNLHVYAESLVQEKLGLSAVLSYDEMDEIVDSICTSILSEAEMQGAFERIDAARLSAEGHLVEALTSATPRTGTEPPSGNARRSSGLGGREAASVSRTVRRLARGVARRPPRRLG